jgi:hypothetical protein
LKPKKLLLSIILDPASAPQNLDMSHNPIKDGEAVVSTALPEKTSPDPVVADVRTFDIDSQDLPEGYFRSPYFIGTLVAAGLSLTAVSSTETGTQKNLRLRYI